jgi:hypothetical protein
LTIGGQARYLRGMLSFEGHAIVSADGMIADATGEVPSSLRNQADWLQYQAALDRSVLVVTGRRGHQRHRNPGRPRLVLTRSVTATAPDPNDPLATFWNPAGMPLEDILAKLAIIDGTIAITGLFDFFLPRLTRFQLSEMHRLILPAGTPCFAAGHPRTVLAGAGLRPTNVELLDPAAMLTSTLWVLDSAGANS